MTSNFERIKSMSIEEVAEEFAVFIPSDKCRDEDYYLGARPNRKYVDYDEAVIDGIKWLQEESK